MGTSAYEYAQTNDVTPPFPTYDNSAKVIKNRPLSMLRNYTEKHNLARPTSILPNDLLSNPTYKERRTTTKAPRHKRNCLRTGGFSAMQ